MSDKTNESIPKRHCMVVHAYYPIGETRVEREALALLDNDYEVDVICLRGTDEPWYEQAQGVNIYRLPMKRHKGRGRFIQLLEYLAFFSLAFSKLISLHRQRRYASIQVHNLPDFLVFTSLVPKMTGARVILDLHDLMPEFYAALTGGDQSRWPVRLVRLQEKVSCRFADHVITVTDVWRKTLIDRGVPEDKVSVVMNVANDRVFYQESGASKPTRNTDTFNLVYHGTFTHRYGVDLIIQAIDKVRHQIPDIHLSLFGEGETRDELIALTKKLNLQKHVHISQNSLHVSELPRVIRQADIGIVPNRSDIFTDGLLPTKLMEYVALGIPVIAARTPTIESYFDDTMVQFFSPGDVADLADCILTLHANPARIDQIAKNSNQFNQTYSWPRVAANYVNLVNQLNAHHLSPAGGREVPPFMRKRAQ